MAFFIIGRRIWGAAAPASAPARDEWRSGVRLVVHHTAGTAPRANKLAEQAEMRNIQRQHQHANGWADIGYNYVIMPSGRVYEGRGFGARGAHTLGANTGTVGVSFAGNYETSRPTLRSIVAYKLLLRRLRLRGARITSITGHGLIPGQATACPGKYLIARLGLRR